MKTGLVHEKSQTNKSMDKLVSLCYNEGPAEKQKEGFSKIYHWWTDGSEKFLISLKSLG